MAFSGFHSVFLKRGLFFFFLVGVFHPDRWLLTAAVLIVIIEFALICVEIFRNRLDSVHSYDARQLGPLSSDFRKEVLGNWLYDAFWAHPARADISLILYLLGQATATAHSWELTGLLVWKRTAAHQQQPTAQEALGWIDLAEEALNLVESELAPRWPAEHQTSLALVLAHGRASIAMTKGLIFQYLNLREEALAAWGDAARSFEKLDQRSLAALCRISVANLLTGIFGQPGDAMHELEPILANPSLNPTLVRHALNAAMVSALGGRDLAAVKAGFNLAHVHFW